MKTKGSVLAYSLFILAMMLIIGIGVSAVSIIEKKSAGDSTSSVQAYQTADSGVQYAIKKISDNSSRTIDATFGNCISGVVSLSNVGAGSYQLSFFKQDGSQVTDCSTTLVNQVASIKSVGTYKDTIRAIDVAVAASSGYLKKYCQIYNNAFTWNDVIPVPDSWTPSDCAGYRYAGANGYVLGCMGDHGIVWGSGGSSLPSPNCGW